MFAAGMRPSKGKLPEILQLEANDAMEKSRGGRVSAA